MAATYSPGLTRVPSAMRDLTSLFGMGRGEHPRQNHHKSFKTQNSKIKFAVSSLSYNNSLFTFDFLLLTLINSYWEQSKNKNKKIKLTGN